MAVRSVYISKNSAPFYEAVDIEFVWDGGFALSQKQKNISAIHEGLGAIHPNTDLLEISSESMQALGRQMSAFSLKKYVPKLEKSIPAENVYQSGKVFELGGSCLLDVYFHNFYCL